MSSLHPSARTLSEFGHLDREVKGSVFMNLAVMATNFIPAFSILLILHCWLLDVTRLV